MPFANMADEDLVAIVSYLRTGEPVRNEVPAARWTPTGKAISALMRPAECCSGVDGMPWGPYTRMSDEDLRAIYRYLNSLDPVANDEVGPTVERVGD